MITMNTFLGDKSAFSLMAATESKSKHIWMNLTLAPWSLQSSIWCSYMWLQNENRNKKRLVGGSRPNPILIFTRINILWVRGTWLSPWRLHLLVGMINRTCCCPEKSLLSASFLPLSFLIYSSTGRTMTSYPFFHGGWILFWKHHLQDWPYSQSWSTL